MGLFLGLGIRMLVVVALVAAAVALPLVSTYRSRCRSGHHIEAHWSFAVPGHEKHRPHCGRPEQGLHYVLGKVGIG
jgi:hypothetical protein